MLQQLEEVLQHEDPTILRQDAQLPPAWIGQFLYTMAKKLDKSHDLVATS
jgi:hypothetical protein